MAGKRHHYIPKFLQTGFLSKTDGETSFTIVYRKGMSPKEISTRHVGVERHFYNKPDNTFLDDLITESESTSYTSTLKGLRKNHDAVNEEVVEDVARLISHFQIRSRNLRQCVIKATNPIVDMLIEEFNDPSRQIEFVKHLGRTQPGGDPMLLAMLDNPNMAEAFVPILADFFNDRNFFEKLLKDKTAESHQTLMKKSIEPEKQVETLRELNYRVLEVKDCPLGDSMTIFRVKRNGQSFWKTIPSKSDHLDYVALPLSKDRLLVGSSDDMTIEYDEIKKGIIECSYEFFISSSISSELEKNINRIGENSNLVSEEEFENGMQKLRKSFFK